MNAAAIVVRNDEANLICRITKRAYDLDKRINRVHLALCLCAVHINVVRLDLDALLMARLVDFWHDVDGILQHTDLNAATLRGFKPMHTAEPVPTPPIINLVSVRDRQCVQCKYEWISEVRLSATTANLSGEATSFCPRCGSREIVSSPVRAVEKPSAHMYGVGGPA